MKAGDRVASFCGLGGFAEEVNAPANATMPIPQGMAFDVGASFTLASRHVLARSDRAALQARETMLVLGAAGGGLYGHRNRQRPLARASSLLFQPDEKPGWSAKEHGADGVINYARDDLREGILRAARSGRDLRSGGGACRTCVSVHWLAGATLSSVLLMGPFPALPMNLLLFEGHPSSACFGEICCSGTRGL